MVSLIRHRSKIIELIPILVILLFLVFQGIISFTLHTHKLPDGRFVTHSHIFEFNKNTNSSDPSKNHNHNEKDYLFYFLVTVINSFILAGLFFKLFRAITAKVLILTSENLYYQVIYSIPSLRAPPLKLNY